MTQKRTGRINLDRMRKCFSPKPLAVGIATVFVAACSDNRQDAQVYLNVEDCISDNPNFAYSCFPTIFKYNMGISNGHNFLL